MISTSSSASDLSCASSSLVFGWSTANEAVTTSRSWRTSSDSIERIAPRYILRLTFWVKSRGCAAKVRPPPTQIGLRIEPARAEPVPFCACGFLPPPRTSARVFCALVPARPAARYALTTWNTSDWLYTWPKFSSDTASSAPPLATLSFMTSGLLVRLVRSCAAAWRGRLHRGAHHDVAAFRSRDGAANQQQVALGIHHHDLAGSRWCGGSRPCGPTCACREIPGPGSGAGRSSPARDATARRRARPCRRRNCGASCTPA